MRQEVYLSSRLGRKWLIQIIRQVLNLPLPFPREFYAANMLRILALRCIYLHGLCGYVISNLKASHRCPSQFERLLRMPICTLWQISWYSCCYCACIWSASYCTCIWSTSKVCLNNTCFLWQNDESSEIREGIQLKYSGLTRKLNRRTKRLFQIQCLMIHL